MFRKALEIAAEYTFPIVMSRKTVAGDCSSSIGTCVVINSDGWIVTAGHILTKWHQLVQGTEATQAVQARHTAIKADASLSKKEIAKQLSAMPIGKDDNDRCSLWFPWPGVKLASMGFYTGVAPGWGEIVDLGVAQLENFDSSWVKTYPVFKDPKKDFKQGASLCKLGFPFHQFRPSWDEAKKSFELPEGALPMPRFPIEGIFTRVSEIRLQGAEAPPYPIRYVETSSPGLPGQSGGPTFDIDGAIWAIQAETSSIALGFAGNQYLNVGLGVHPDTMFPIFDMAGIKYQTSA